jgi:hypothetical protein
MPYLLMCSHKLLFYELWITLWLKCVEQGNDYVLFSLKRIPSGDDTATLAEENRLL